jgi:hypothetical protein
MSEGSLLDADQLRNQNAEKNEVRAGRRLGQLIAEQKAAHGLNTGAKGKKVTPTGTVVVKDDAPTLASAGIDKKLSSRSQKLAAVPAAELLELAIERNASHGLQLSQQDKQDMARRIYNGTPDGERDEKKKHLAKILAVSERTVRDCSH